MDENTRRNTQERPTRREDLPLSHAASPIREDTPGFFRDERLFPKGRRMGPRPPAPSYGQTQPRHGASDAYDGMTGRIPLHDEPAGRTYTSSTRQRDYGEPARERTSYTQETTRPQQQTAYTRESTRPQRQTDYTQETTRPQQQTSYTRESTRPQRQINYTQETTRPQQQTAYTQESTRPQRQTNYTQETTRPQQQTSHTRESETYFRDERLFPQGGRGQAVVRGTSAQPDPLSAEFRQDGLQGLYEDEPQEAYGEDFPPELYGDEPTPGPDSPARLARKDRAQKKEDQRAKLEKRLSRVALGILGSIFLAACVLMLAMPRSTVSYIEKRQLATFPVFSLDSYFSGDYTADVANFYDDTVPMRDDLKNMGNNFKGLFGLPKSDDSVEFVGNVNKVNPDQGKAGDTPKPTPAPQDDASSQPAAVPVNSDENQQIGNGAQVLTGAAGRYMDGQAPAGNRFVEEEADGDFTENGLIVLKQDGHYRALELFGGGSGDSYAQSLNELHSQLGDSVKIWSMPAPLACEFYTPSNFQEFTTSQSDCFDKVAAKLDAGIQSINICGTLSQHVTEPIYCRTDHHWQPLGAYYAAKAFAEAAGVPFSDISTYTPKTIEGFVGSMYSFTGSSDILNDPEDFTYYVPATPYTSVYYDTYFDFQWDDDDLFAEGASGSDAYMVFLGGDSYVIKTDTQVENGRTLLIVKDSYGNATVPFFTGSFQQIYVLDMRYFERNLVSFIRDMGVTDVLFTMSSYSLVGDQADNLSNLISQNAGESISDTQSASGEAE